MHYSEIPWLNLGNQGGASPSNELEKEEVERTEIPTVKVDNMQISAGAVTPPTPESGWWAGDKYYGGFGPTQLFTMDYWTLRERSGQLFRENLYARGLVRRIITNKINTGLTLEATPDGSILGMNDDEIADWAESTENRFQIWAKNPKLCDWEGRRTFGKLQQEAELEALVDGDILIMLYQSKKTKLPQVRLVKGSNVQTPMNQTGLKKGNKIEHGVEIDPLGKHVAFWVTGTDGKSKRVPAFGPRTGRRIAWLLYGTDKRLDDVRGEPLLSLVLQSLKEVDRYRDAALRKATINSILAMFIEKGEAKIGTNPISGGAIRKDSLAVEDDTNSVRQFKVAKQIPGMVIEELQHGERPVPHSTAGTDVNFGPFSEAIIQAIAWANEIPPEILRLTFSSNYSASAAAINEFRMYLNMKRTDFGDNMPQPIYVEWLLSEVLVGRIVARGLLEAWRDVNQYDIYGAWVASDWSGAVKPSTDIVKQAKGYKIQVDEGWITNERVARELNGSKFRKNMKRIRRENELKVEANKVLQELEAGESMPADGNAASAEAIDEAVVNLQDFVGDLSR